MHCIEFDEHGTATCLHTDALPLAELGTLSMTRASNVEWSDVSQKWQVSFCFNVPGAKAGEIAFESESRQECLEWEKSYFNSYLMNR